MFRRFRAAAIVSALLLVAPALAHNGVVHHGPLNISVPFTRATLPNAPVAGGYLTIENTGDAADRLVSATSPAAGTVQLHQMKMEGDVMKMSPLADGITIEAGQTVALEPGGLHMMFLGLTQPFVEGESVPVTLVFEHAGPVEIEIPVQAADATEAHGAGEHAHDALEGEHSHEAPEGEHSH